VRVLSINSNNHDKESKQVEKSSPANQHRDPESYTPKEMSPRDANAGHEEEAKRMPDRLRCVIAFFLLLFFFFVAFSGVCVS
jgi:hypothetical protein